MTADGPGGVADDAHIRRAIHRTTFELSQRLEPCAHHIHQELRLFPRREMPALVELVVIDEVGIGLLRPSPRRMVDLVRKDAQRNRDCDVLWAQVGLGEPLPIETRRRDCRSSTRTMWRCCKEETYRTSARKYLAASLAQLGRLEEERWEAEMFLLSNPHFTINHWASTQPIRRSNSCAAKEVNR
jgi:hypothetical protein